MTYESVYPLMMSYSTLVLILVVGSSFLSRYSVDLIIGKF